MELKLHLCGIALMAYLSDNLLHFMPIGIGGSDDNYDDEFED